VTRTDTKESLTFGQLTKGEKLLKTVDERAPITPAAQWKTAGKPITKVDGRHYVTGRHQYASDISRPGMLYGKVLRPSALQATLLSADTSAAEALPGVPS